MTMLKLRPDEQRAIGTQAAAKRKAAVEVEDRAVAKLERELDKFEASLKVDPPPELSPAEQRERELVERLERLEGKDPPPIGAMLSASDFTRENRLKSELRIRLVERERKAVEVRELADGTADRREQFDERKRAILVQRDATQREERERAEARSDAATQRAIAEITELGVRP